MGSNRSVNESPFHTEGPTTENARVCLMEVQPKETKSTSGTQDGTARISQVIRSRHMLTKAAIQNIIRYFNDKQVQKYLGNQ